MGGEIPEAAEVIKMDDLPVEEPEQEAVAPFVSQYASIGDVLQHGVTQEIPDGWHECDGSVQRTHAWPDFAEALKIAEPTFTLPKPERVLPGQRWIIKLGRHVVRAMPPPPLPSGQSERPSEVLMPDDVQEVP